mmetsp:Transcript_14939/g.27595  ORF Transcript_14939/g.27595 Transcript_14939/m.27595 type:complete len:193 (+) Transcript_14939:213-791(+)
MHSDRSAHCTIFYEGYLYVIGGRVIRNSFSPKSEYSYFADRDLTTNTSERYNCKDNTWEFFRSIPHSFWGMSAIVLKASNKLYALGGAVRYEEYTDLIQQLDLSSLTWQVLPCMLPWRDYYLSCFKLEEDQFYFITHSQLFKFTNNPPSIEAVSTLSVLVPYCRSPCYYSSGVLYCSSGSHAASKIKFSLIN